VTKQNKTPVKVQVLKVVIDDALKVRLKIQCIKLGKPQQLVIGKLIQTWVESRESKH